MWSPAGFLQGSVGIVFLIAAIMKLGSASGVLSPFLEAVGIERGTAMRVAAAVPTIELVIGLLLLARVLQPLVSLVAAVTALAFASILGLARIRHVDVPCRCFGQLDSHATGPEPLIRAVLLAVAASTLAIISWRVTSTAVVAVASTSYWPSVASGVVSAAGLLVCLTIVGDMRLFKQRVDSVLGVEEQ